MNKFGTTPTTFDVTTSGSATSTMAGPRQAFDYGAQSSTMQVGITGTTATAGVQSGSIVVNNTDLTTAAAGQGSADGNDTVNVTGTVVDPSNASFSLALSTKTLAINFGSMYVGSPNDSRAFSLGNIASASGYTAGLQLVSVTGTGSTTKLTTNLAAFADLAAGQSSAFSALINTSTPGTFTAEYTLGVADENIPGASSGTSLTLDLTGTVLVPDPGRGGLLVLMGLLPMRRRGRATGKSV